MLKSCLAFSRMPQKLYPSLTVVSKSPIRAFSIAPALRKHATPVLYNPLSKIKGVRKDPTKKSPLSSLLNNNAEWSKNIHQTDPTFFARSAEKQSPKILWLGCSDSRVSAEQIVGAGPGELFVHRNVANLCIHTDLNCLSVIQYAVDVLKIEHIIVCGHYGCGGVAAAMRPDLNGLIDNWLVNIKDVYAANKERFEGVEDQKSREDLLSELNVGNTVQSICHTAIVQQAWKRGQNLSVHGWIYGLEDGLINELGWCVSSPDQLESVYVYQNPMPTKRRRALPRPKPESV
ncbi:carbonic anhydrase [Basidiobolus meristosporus CBS 931.73]|uniref:Carbonic anhydrase n=1 Tax=Basidiobolus meristosporus CBS 931.73 TaxID=1314790 RepID=A0A1Y1XKU1_9FUNG|nr:carbonic anhydrase [Basidiobolus meristosporus CBS 931.73]|eukprot:ORX85954.1 carbonic anhydrase [Basidiobolus meristosporus CBS 931.73]